MAVLYGRAERLTSQNGGFGPGQVAAVVERVVAAVARGQVSLEQFGTVQNGVQQLVGDLNCSILSSAVGGAAGAAEGAHAGRRRGRAPYQGRLRRGISDILLPHSRSYGESL